MYQYYENLEDYKVSVLNNNVMTDYYFPKGFFITPNGYLYNTSKANGHKYNNFVREYEYIIKLLKSNKKLPNFGLDIDFFNNKLNMVKNHKYIDYDSIKSWLETIYDIPANISLNIDDPDKRRMNQIVLTKLYKGYCDASIEFYKFFASNFSNNYMQRYNDIDNILGNVNVYDKLVEILVRCIGFHKVELHNVKNITTSSLYPVSDFYEYLINGFNVWVVPKIVNKDGFKEIDIINSIPISTYKAIERFEDENPDKGKIRILGM